MGLDLGIRYCSFCGISSDEDKNFNKKCGLCNKHLIQMKRHGRCFTDEEMKERRRELNPKTTTRNMINGELIYWKNELGTWCYNLDKLKEFVFNESSKYSCVSEFCKSIGVYRDFFKKIEELENIKFKYNFILKKNDNKFKAIYQDYDWCYQKYIIEGLNHQEMANEANCTVRVIEKWCQDKHGLNQKYRQKNKRFNDIQSDLIIGSLIGDGHIDKREVQPIFIVSHAENQKDYLYWKYELLKDFCNIPPVRAEASLKPFGEKYYKCQPNYRMCTRIHDDLIKFRNMSIEDVIKSLNEFSLSIFVLDDGYRANSYWEICVAMFSDNDKQLLIEKLKEFNINAYIVNSDNRYIKLKCDDSKRLDEIILKNIPNDLDIIKYKILNKRVKKEC